MFNEIQHLQDMMLVESIVNAINAHAGVRAYDVLTIVVSMFSLLASILIATIAYELNKKQIEIANRQSEISKKQTEIMEQQNRIALFEKRFYYFKIYTNIILNIQSIEGKWTSQSKCKISYHEDIFIELTNEMLLEKTQKIMQQPQTDSERANRLLERIHELQYLEYVYQLTSEERDNLLNLITIVHTVLMSLFELCVEDQSSTSNDKKTINFEEIDSNILMLINNYKQLSIAHILNKQLYINPKD